MHKNDLYICDSYYLFSTLLSTAIEIGFTVQRINHTEDFRQFAATINKSRVSEQTFELRIEIGTFLSRYGLRATQGEDFQIGGVTQQNQTFLIMQMTPEQNSISLIYQILGDIIPENQEVFQLYVTPNPNSPAFYCSYNGCYPRIEIVIIDDDGELYNFFL